MLLHSSQFHGCMIRCFMPRFSMLYCFTAPGSMLLHAVCRYMLYANPLLDSSPSVDMLLYASQFYASCSYFATLYFAGPYLTGPSFAVPCFMLGCSLLYLSMLRGPLFLLLMLCSAVSSIATPCFTVPSFCPMLLHLSLVAVSYFAAPCFAAS
jgi:hypothetical protein